MSFHVIGAQEVVLGFGFIGIPGTVARTAEEVRDAFRAVTSAGKARVVILTEQASGLIEEEIMEWQLAGAYPLVVEVPGLEGHRPDRVTLIDSIRDAVGLQV